MVNSINDSPLAVDDAAATAFDTTLEAIPVLANDTDPEDDVLRVVSASSAEGTVTINPDGTLNFTPLTGFSGLATILYRISDRPPGDAEALMDDGAVTVRVGEAPVLARDGIVEGTDGADIIDASYDGDPDGDFVDRGDALLPGQAPDDDIILAGAGDDDIRAGAGNDSVLAGAGADLVSTGAGNDTVFGGSGDDVIDTSGPDLAPDLGYPEAAGDALGYAPDSDPDNDRDSVDGGAGDDTIRTGDDRDTINGGIGADAIHAGIDDDLVDGGAGADRIVGSEGNDTLLGGDGDDTILAGADPLDLPDLVSIEDRAGLGGSPFAPDRNPDNGRDFVDGGAGDDQIFGADDRDTLIGGAGDDLIDGQIDDDLLRGGEGDDTLRGGEGADTMIGGGGRDVFAGLSAGDVVDGGDGPVDFDMLDLRGSALAGERLRIEFTSDDREDGIVRYFDADEVETGRLVFEEIESVVPCFTPGTRIATRQGERRVEDLQVGDRVITRDNGIQEIRWIGDRGLSGAEMAHAAQMRPVLIRQGALGNGLPERDMMVSPNHRVLIASDKSALFFDQREVLVAAKHLTGRPGIDVVEVSGVRYIHMMFDRHEVVLSDGAWTESFQPGDMSLAGVGGAQRDEIFALFPELATQVGIDSYAAARRSLKKHEAQVLME